MQICREILQSGIKTAQARVLNIHLLVTTLLVVINTFPGHKSTLCMSFMWRFNKRPGVIKAARDDGALVCVGRYF